MRLDKKLLIVSDQEGDLQFLKDFFAVRDFTVETAADTTEAQEKVTWYKPSIVILDINGSDTDLSFTEAIKNSNAETDVIILASSADSARVSKAKELKVQEYIVKPYSLRNLERVVQGLA